MKKILPAFIRGNYSKNSLLLFLLFMAVCLGILDPDLGWHLRSGEYILQHGVPHFDIFTYTARNFVWINHEWLSDVITWIVYNAFGYVGISIFYSGAWVLAMLLASRKGNSFLLLLASLAMASYAGIRPVVWSVLFFVLLERIIESRNKKPAFFLPFLFLIWANLHGGFALGLVVLGFFTLFVREKKLSILLFTLSVGATFINPYGLSLFHEVGRTLIDVRIHFRILEWFPLSFDAFGVFYIGLFGALFFATYKKNRLKHLLSLPTALLAASLLSTRYLPFFIVSSLRSMEEYFEKLKKSIPPNLAGSRLTLWRLLQTLAVAVIVYGLAHQILVIPRDRESIFPEKAVHFLATHPCVGNLFNSYDYGGYLLWKLPQQKVYIDGRMPSWQSGDITYLDRYVRVLSDRRYRTAEFKKYNVTCALLQINHKKSQIATYLKLKDIPGEELLANELLKEGWTRKVEDPKSVLLVK